MAQVGKLQEAVTANPNDYDSHVLLISALRSAVRRRAASMPAALAGIGFVWWALQGSQSLLTAARESMATVFPLTPALWLEWLADEVATRSEGAACAASTDHAAGLHQTFGFRECASGLRTV
jgi:hypothetical protein